MQSHKDSLFLNLKQAIAFFLIAIALILPSSIMIYDLILDATIPDALTQKE